VACTSGDSCVAVGWYSTMPFPPTEFTQSLIETSSS
jgi:hypothetical protein